MLVVREHIHGKFRIGDLDNVCSEANAAEHFITEYLILDILLVDTLKTYVVFLTRKILSVKPVIEVLRHFINPQKIFFIYV